MILPHNKLSCVRILLFDVNTKICADGPSRYLKSGITTICQSTNCLLLLLSDIIAAWRQIVLVMKRFVFICGVF
jgi:hypothetical protein